MFFFCEEVKDSVDLGRGVAAFDHAFKLIGHCKRHGNSLVLGTTMRRKLAHLGPVWRKSESGHVYTSIQGTSGFDAARLTHGSSLNSP
jgi:hypothetical protein